jgi:isopenicillin N synthase-like dioxygenase
MIINAGEIMQWFTGGFFKAAIHRVVEPPSDQKGHDRCSVFYFVVPNKDVVINTILDQSPVLRQAGVTMAHKPGDAPTSEEWCTGRVKITGKGDKFDGKSGAAEVEKVGKVTTTWFR